MRPRQSSLGIRSWGRVNRASTTRPSFNEAEAIKPRNRAGCAATWRGSIAAASMRPRQSSLGISAVPAVRLAHPVEKPRFNEAEAIKPRNHEAPLASSAWCRQASASMRPRQSSLGIADTLDYRAKGNSALASMRPRQSSLGIITVLLQVGASRHHSSCFNEAEAIKPRNRG